MKKYFVLVLMVLLLLSSVLAETVINTGNAGYELRRGHNVATMLSQAKVIELDDGSYWIEINFPGSKNKYVINSPFCPSPGWSATYDDTTVKAIVKSPLGKRYIFDDNVNDPNKIRLDEITIRSSDGSTDIDSVDFQYDVSDRLEKIIDIQDSGNYLLFSYDLNGYVNKITVFASGFVAGTPESQRVYYLTNDSSGRLESVSITSGSGCGCSGSGDDWLENEYDSYGKVIKKKDSDGNLIYEYIYDYGNPDNIRLTAVKNGSGEYIRRKNYSQENGYARYDTFYFTDSNNYRLKSIFRDQHGRPSIIKTFENTGSDLIALTVPQGQNFIETTIYNYDMVNNKDLGFVKILPKGHSDDKGVREEHVRVYDNPADEFSGWEEIRKKIDSTGNEVILSKERYDHFKISGKDHANQVRLMWSQNSSMVDKGSAYRYNYTYTGSDTDLLRKKEYSLTVPTVSSTIKPKTEYSYDSYDRLIQEKAYDNYTLKKQDNYKYDDYGRIIKIWRGTAEGTDDTRGASTENIITEYYYNSFGDLLYTISPEGVVTGRIYDGSGRLFSEYIYAGSYSDWDTWFTVYKAAADLQAAYIELSKLRFVSRTKYTYDDTTGKVKYLDKVVHKGVFTLSHDDIKILYGAALERIGTDPSLIEGLKSVLLTQQQIDDLLPPALWTRTEYHYDLYSRKDYEIVDALALDEHLQVLPNYNPNPEKLKTQYEYNLQNEVVKVTKPNGVWTRTIHDGRGFAVKKIVSSGPEGASGVYEPAPDSKYNNIPYSVTKYKYDANGNVIEIIKPDGVKVVRKYDDFNRLIRESRVSAP